MSVRKVCDELELTFGRCESDARALLKTEGIKEPTEEQLKDTLNRVEEEHHAIIFLYKSDRQKFGKYITEKENEIIQKKDPFPKNANDGAAFATTDAGINKGKGKNKKVTCFKCKKQGHYANKCDKENTDDEGDNMKKKMTNKKAQIL